VCIGNLNKNKIYLIKQNKKGLNLMIKLIAVSATIVTGLVTSSFSMQKDDDDRSVTSKSARFAPGVKSPGKSGVAVQTQSVMKLRAETQIYHPVFKNEHTTHAIIATLKKAQNQQLKVLLNETDLDLLKKRLENLMEQNQELQQYASSQQELELLQPQIKSLKQEIVNLKRAALMKEGQHQATEKDDVMNALLSDIARLNERNEGLAVELTRTKMQATDYSREVLLLRSTSDAKERELEKYKLYVQEAALRLGHTDIMSSVNLAEAVENGSVQTRSSKAPTIANTVKTGKSKAVSGGNISLLPFMEGPVFEILDISKFIADQEIESVIRIEKKDQSHAIGLFLPMKHIIDENLTPENLLSTENKSGFSLEIRDYSVDGTPKILTEKSYSFKGSRSSQTVELFYNKALEILCAGELMHPKRDALIKLVRSVFRSELNTSDEKILAMDVDKDGDVIKGARIYIKSEENNNLVVLSFFTDLENYYPETSYGFLPAVN
jgi:hypothetical protein